MPITKKQASKEAKMAFAKVRAGLNGLYCMAEDSKGAPWLIVAADKKDATGKLKRKLSEMNAELKFTKISAGRIVDGSGLVPEKIKGVGEAKPSVATKLYKAMKVDSDWKKLVSKLSFSTDDEKLEATGDMGDTEMITLLHEAALMDDDDAQELMVRGPAITAALKRLPDLKSLQLEVLGAMDDDDLDDYDVQDPIRRSDNFTEDGTENDLGGLRVLDADTDGDPEFNDPDSQVYDDVEALGKLQARMVAKIKKMKDIKPTLFEKLIKKDPKKGYLVVRFPTADYPALVHLRGMPKDLMPDAPRAAYTDGAAGRCTIYAGRLYLQMKDATAARIAKNVLGQHGMPVVYCGTSISKYVAADAKGRADLVKTVKDETGPELEMNISEYDRAEVLAQIRKNPDDPRLVAFMKENGLTIDEVTDAQISGAMKEIGLVALLSDPKRASLFIKHLKDEFGLENLAFMVATSPMLTKLRPLCGEQLAGLGECGSKSARITWIYNQFASTTAKYQINLSYRARKPIIAAFEADTDDAIINKSPVAFYAPAFKDILQNLNEIYKRFYNS